MGNLISSGNKQEKGVFCENGHFCSGEPLGVEELDISNIRSLLIQSSNENIVNEEGCVFPYVIVVRNSAPDPALGDVFINLKSLKNHFISLIHPRKDGTISRIEDEFDVQIHLWTDLRGIFNFLYDTDLDWRKRIISSLKREESFHRLGQDEKWKMWISMNSKANRRTKHQRKPPSKLIESPIKKRKRRSKRNNKNKCVICMDRECDYVVLPCMHKCLCCKCSTMLITSCPLCRRKVDDIKRIYE